VILIVVHKFGTQSFGDEFLLKTTHFTGRV